MSPRVSAAMSDVAATIDKHAESMSRAECIDFICGLALANLLHLKACAEEQEGAGE